MLQVLPFNDVGVYEARSKYWSGEILKGISGGESLYLSEKQWGFTIRCYADGKPHSVTFGNGTVWSFCGMNKRLLNNEWPLFVKDFFGADGHKIYARVEGIYSDSMRLHIGSQNARLNDMLIWRHPVVH